MVDFKTEEQLSQILLNPDHSKRDLSMSASSSKLLSYSPSRTGPQKQSNQRSPIPQHGKAFRSGSMSPVSPKALNEMVNGQVPHHHHKSARSLTPTKKKIQFQVEMNQDRGGLTIDDLADESEVSRLKHAQGDNDQGFLRDYIILPDV
jgi:hypothetical protein